MSEILGGGGPPLWKAQEGVELVPRAVASGRPVRVLYISDFDPAGNGMPVAVARKIEFLLYQQRPRTKPLACRS